jgi:uncharacterized protein YecT (DUF1311 family)
MFLQSKGFIGREAHCSLQKVLSKVNADDADRLKKAQRLWAEYRGANCSAERALY